MTAEQSHTFPSPDELVGEFHTTFKVPEPNPAPASLDFERAPMRMDLISEEFCELLDAFYGPAVGTLVRQSITKAIADADEGTRDIQGVLDALGDMIYVEYGFAREANIPLDAGIAEIHRSNMSKLGADGEPLLREDGKVLKGPDYTPPNLGRVLAVHAARVTGHPVAGSFNDWTVWDGRNLFALASARHAHTTDGECVKNLDAARCRPQDVIAG